MKHSIQINCELTEKQIVDLAKVDFKDAKKSIEIINWHLDNLEYNHNYYSPKINEIRNGLRSEIQYQKSKISH